MRPDPPVLCECGCGEPAPIAKSNHRLKGHLKGQPVRFINGHNNRGPKSPETRAKMKAAWAGTPRPWLRKPRPSIWSPEPLSSTLHAYINRTYPKTGRCEGCGREARTDYAFMLHPNPYTRNRIDYRELCRSCHVRLDYANGTRK